MPLVWDLVSYPSAQKFGGLVSIAPSLLTPVTPDSVVWGTHYWHSPSSTWLLLHKSLNRSSPVSSLESVSRRSAMPFKKASTVKLGTAVEISMLLRLWLPGLYLCTGWANAWIKQLAKAVMCQVSPPRGSLWYTGPRSLWSTLLPSHHLPLNLQWILPSVMLPLQLSCGTQRLPLLFEFS